MSVYFLSSLLVFFVFFFFFFSSRRRHTRLVSDWSSDVCSSDLAELFDERHMRGTLLAYREHRVSEDFYASPGERDLTAHVNFTALETWGKRSGLETAEFTSQTAFLLALGQGNEFADLYDAGQSESEQVRARLQLKTLIHPEGMGERFQVLVQRKGVIAEQI